MAVECIKKRLETLVFASSPISRGTLTVPFLKVWLHNLPNCSFSVILWHRLIPSTVNHNVIRSSIHHCLVLLSLDDLGSQFLDDGISVFLRNWSQPLLFDSPWKSLNVEKDLGWGAANVLRRVAQRRKDRVHYISYIEGTPLLGFNPERVHELVQKCKLGQ
jgi:hypothetical protein